MTILPTNLTSFIWGALVGVGTVFVSGFLKKAGEEAFTAVQARLDPKPPEPVEVSRGFQPPTGAEYTWIPEAKRHECEQKGFTYFLDSKTGARHFRRIAGDREFLMIRPVA